MSTSAMAVAGRFAAGLAIFIAGGAIFLAGVSMLVWMVMNLFWPQKEAVGEVGHLSVPVICMAFGGYLTKLGWSKRAASAGQSPGPASSDGGPDRAALPANADFDELPSV